MNDSKLLFSNPLTPGRYCVGAEDAFNFLNERGLDPEDINELMKEPTLSFIISIFIENNKSNWKFHALTNLDEIKKNFPPSSQLREELFAMIEDEDRIEDLDSNYEKTAALLDAALGRSRTRVDTEGRTFLTLQAPKEGDETFSLRMLMPQLLTEGSGLVISTSREEWALTYGDILSVWRYLTFSAVGIENQFLFHPDRYSASGSLEVSGFFEINRYYFPFFAEAATLKFLSDKNSNSSFSLVGIDLVDANPPSRVILMADNSFMNSEKYTQAIEDLELFVPYGYDIFDPRQSTALIESIRNTMSK